MFTRRPNGKIDILGAELSNQTIHIYYYNSSNKAGQQSAVGRVPDS